MTTKQHPFFAVVKTALSGKGYTSEIGQYLTAGGAEETRMYVSHKNGAIRRSAARITIGEDGFPIVGKAFAASKVADVKAIYEIVTLVARGL